jgi:hypothetical protein
MWLVLRKSGTGRLAAVAAAVTGLLVVRCCRAGLSVLRWSESAGPGLGRSGASRLAAVPLAS